MVPRGKSIAYGTHRVPTVGCPKCNPPKPIGQGRTFESFKTVPGTEMMIESAKAVVNGTGPAGLTIVGVNGCGKTHMIEAIANAQMRSMQRPSYVFIPDFLNRLRATFEPESDWRYQDLWDRWAKVRLLLLDDLSDTARPTPWAVGQIELIIDTRYRQAMPYVITTNGTIESIERVWGRRIADRMFDERSETVRVVYNTAPSYRTGRPWS